jgi:hypothetical protein
MPPDAGELSSENATCLDIPTVARSVPDTYVIS